MTQVHVYVSPQLDEVRSWAAAFDGAIDLYRFSSNNEAYERLTGATAPVHVIILGCDRADAFDLSSAHLAQRLVSRPLEAHPMLAQMQIVLVAPSGAANLPQSPRIHVVSSHDAAIRLVKFGQAEEAPQPQVSIDSAGARTATAPSPGLYATANQPEVFAGSVISQIWDMADAAPSRREVAQAAQQPRQNQQRGPRIIGGGPTRSAQPEAAPTQRFDAQHESVRVVQASRSSGKISTGHAPSASESVPAHGVASSGSLFAHGGSKPQAVSAPAPVAMAPAQAAPDHAQVMNALQQHMPQQPVVQQSQHAMPVMSSNNGLQASQPWGGTSGEYRGPASVRGSGVHAAAFDHVAQQQPYMQPQVNQTVSQAHVTMVPGVAQQVQHIVYPGQQPASDPLLGFSASVQQQLGGQPTMLATSTTAPAPSPQQHAAVARQAGGMHDTSSALMARAESGGVAYG
ncbi:MAG: hypothetical protein H7123_00990 [Thermoleophilia bacterium]|nr:hypothetical protein [Thermoleophilia bacterium]